MCVRTLSTLFFLWWTMMTSIDSKRVLLMPFPTPSRSLMHLELARPLVARGHDVTIVLCDWVSNMGILNSTGISVIDYHTTLNFEETFINDHLKRFFAEDMSGTAKEQFYSFSDEILSNQYLYEEMKSVQADFFVFDDAISISKMFAVFAYKLDIPFACLDIAFQPFNRRIPFSPAAIPAFMSSFPHHMDILQRLQNTWTFFRNHVHAPLFRHDAVARYAPEKDYLPLDRLVARAELWLIESDPIMQFPYPTLPNVKHIGGIMASPPKPLDPRFQAFMDSAKHGVIVVSFGSMVVNLPEKIYDKLMSAFLKLSPMKVVFRANVTSPDTRQILTSLWLPQNSLLAHPNCKLLVSHSGMSSHYQALYHAVPILDLPLLYDQVQNAQVIQQKGFGFSLDIRKITADDLVKAIKELVENPRYKDTISRASELYRALYGIPRETAVYWLDHVMKYGGGYMRSSGQEMPLYQFLLLDVLLIVVTCQVAVLAFTCGCVYWSYWKCRGRKEKRE